MPSSPPTPAHPALIDAPCTTAYVRLLLRRWPRHAAALADGSGLSAAQLAQAHSISVTQELRILANADMLAREQGIDWVSALMRDMNIGCHGPLGVAAVSAPTLGDGLDVMACYAPTRLPFISLRLIEDGPRLHVVVEIALAVAEPQTRPLVELVLHALLGYVATVLGEAVSGYSLSFRHAADEVRERYARLFPVPCQLAAPHDALVLPLGFRDVRCPLHDETLYRAALLRCREALDAAMPPDDLLQRSRHWLALQFDRIAQGREAPALPTLEQLAATLHLAPRSVIRRLATKGASFSTLRAEAQLELARQLLADPRFTAAEVGLRLGYGDPANFVRAFRRLTGMTPSQFRRTPDASKVGAGETARNAPLTTNKPPKAE